VILSPKIAEMAANLADTDDAILPLFSPLDRAFIIALKKVSQNQEIP